MPRAIEPLETSTSVGRRVAVWRTGGDAPAGESPVALVLPGFARRMRHMSAVALYLADAGFAVYRCDYLDHVGLSDGSIFDFTMSSMYESQAAALELVHKREGREAVIVAASLANRTALRLAAQTEGVVGLIGIVGVVDSRRTLHKVFGEDYATYSVEQVPDHVVFENRRIRGLSWHEDWHAANWAGIDGTVEDLRGLDCPVVNFCGTDDDWVAIADVNRVFAKGAGGPRRLIELPYVEHELSSNPVAGQALMRELVREAAACAGTDAPGAEAEPTFARIAEQVLYERSFEAELAGADGAAPDTRTV